MKRTLLILIGGLALAAAAYICVYLAGTAPLRSLARSEQPALAWIQQEYHLTAVQFARLCELHDAYRPQCMAMCEKIAAKNAQLQTLLAATNVITPEIKQALADAAQIRAECQAGMFAHFYAVAQTMPPEQARRYLEWVRSATLETSPMLPHQSMSPAPHMP